MSAQGHERPHRPLCMAMLTPSLVWAYWMRGSTSGTYFAPWEFPRKRHANSQASPVSTPLCARVSNAAPTAGVIITGTSIRGQHARRGWRAAI